MGWTFGFPEITDILSAHGFEMKCGHLHVEPNENEASDILQPGELCHKTSHLLTKIESS